MSESSRQRMWLVAVLLLIAVVVWQFVAIRGLRAEREAAQQLAEKARIESERLREIPRRRAEMVEAGRWLHRFYQSQEEGLGRPNGLWIHDQPDFEGIGAWLLDVYLSARIEGATEEEARQRVVDGIQATEEWRLSRPAP